MRPNYSRKMKLPNRLLLLAGLLQSSLSPDYSPLLAHDPKKEGKVYWIFFMQTSFSEHQHRYYPESDILRYRNWIYKLFFRSAVAGEREGFNNGAGFSQPLSLLKINRLKGDKYDATFKKKDKSVKN
jgi:hypothetical protein